MEANENTQTAGDELIVTIYLAAMSRPAEERAEFLAEVCAGKEALRLEVQRRVDWEQRMGGFLAGPVRPLWEDPVEIGNLLLKRFRILRVAGEGGMAKVYEAYDEKLGTKIALKCPRFEFRQRVTPEVLKALSVTHPNVCRVFEIHTMETRTGELDFLTMEFIAGETLASRLTWSPKAFLQTPEGLSVARQICAGLTAVHAAGVIHRDLKPNNVMLAKQGEDGLRAVIMDFGIAQGSDIFSSQMRGTPSYLAPEIWRGGQATVRSDIYALGVLLYQMACGERPFTEQCNWKDRLSTAPAPPAVEEPFRSAIQRCLAPDPKDRPESVAQFEGLIWGGNTRRNLLRGAGMAVAAGLGGWWLKQQFWPSSPIRLVVLPPAEKEGEHGLLLSAFRHDLAYRIKTLRNPQRPLTVFSYAQSIEEGVLDGRAAQSILKATHCLSVRWDPANNELSSELHDVTFGRRLASWKHTSNHANLAEALFQLQSQVVPQTIAQLKLRSESQRQTLPQAAYANYLQGLQFARIQYERALEAIPFFEAVIAAAPNSALGYAGMAEALLMAAFITGDETHHRKALSILARAEQLDPEEPHVQLMMGRFNAYEGLNERALSYFRRASELDPNDSQAYIGMGYSLLYLGRYPEAEVAFLSAVKAQPGYYKPLVDLGLFYFEAGDYANAERHWLESMRCNPGHTRARLNLGSIQVLTNRAAEALVAADECLRIRENTSAWALKADALHELHRDVEALEAFEKASRGKPADFRTWAPLAAAYGRANRREDAWQALRRGLEETKGKLAINPRDPERLAWAAFYHAALGEVDEARRRAAEALAIAEPPVGRIRHRVLIAYDRIGDLAAAEKLLNGASKALLHQLKQEGELSPALLRASAFSRSH